MKLNYLYHGSPIQNIKVLEPRMKTKRSDQKEARVYAVKTRTEAAIFAIPYLDNNISWKNDKIRLHIKNKKTYKKHPISIYKLSSENFKDVDGMGFEWHVTKPVKVLREYKIKDAIKYAKRNGAVIKDETE